MIPELRDVVNALIVVFSREVSQFDVAVLPSAGPTALFHERNLRYQIMSMRAALTRMLRLLEQSLPELAYLSCVVPPAGSMVPVGMDRQPFAAPELDVQLHEILDFVALQEEGWGLEGAPGPPIRRSGGPRPT